MKSTNVSKGRRVALTGVLAFVLSWLLGCQAQTHSGTSKNSPASKNSSAAAPAYPLKLSANRRYLVGQNKVPFLLVGDSPQGIMGRLTEEEADHYFANRQSHGFNTLGWVDVLCAGRDFPDNIDAATPDGIRPFLGYLPGGNDYAHYDLGKPNDAYFTRLDHIVALALKHGLFTFLDPAETNGWLPTLRKNGLTAAYAYGQYLGNRYKSFPNLGWLSGNDFITWKDPKDDALVQAVAKGIQSTDPGHLQTVELNYETSSSLDDPGWAPLISLNGTYTYSPTYMQMLRSYYQRPVIPVYLVEAHYDQENVGHPPDYGTPPVLRREEYWTMLTGGTGVFYGNFYTWSFSPGWKYYIDTAGVAQLRIWKDFFSSLPWYELIPNLDHSTVTAGLGTYGSFKTPVSKSDFCTAAKTADGSFVVAYLPTARTITVNMAGCKAPVKAQWFDPTNGAYSPVSAAPLANRGMRQFTPPGNNRDGDTDWVLLLDASNSAISSKSSPE
jgi:Protein of unknown function (DUF4038)/Putative collagen-binding domain of a collagenase